MSTVTGKGFRFSKSQGESLSEQRGVMVRQLSQQSEDADSLALRATFGSPAWRKRARTQGDMDRPDSPDLSPHYPLPFVPPLPPSHKEHGDTTRPKAAVMPSSPIFVATTSPIPLATRPSSRTASSKFSSSTTIAVPQDVTMNDGRGQENDPEKPNKFEAYEKQGCPLMGEQQNQPSNALQTKTELILAEQRSLAMVKLHKQLTATQGVASFPRQIAANGVLKAPVLEKIGFFHRARRSPATPSPESSTTTSVDSSCAQSMSSFWSPMNAVEPGSQLVTPPSSPKSATCAHNGYVKVFYQSEYAKIGVSETTDTVDALRQAAEAMNNPLNTAASIMFECYAPLGLERRLRRYERIQEVIDSWPNDSQNSLLIRQAWGPASNKDLDISSVAVGEAPTTFILQLYHCSRPGKWQKRWVTLLGDGQMLSSRTPDLSLGRDCQRLCDLSEYDIYTVMSETSTLKDDMKAKNGRANLVKNIKPPKRYCFAVKSQLKPTTYPTTTSYTHFFSTEDVATARKFYTLVHAWRSWYMVKARQNMQRRRLMDTAMDTVPQITPVKHVPQKSISHLKISPGHRIRVSVDETPYTIGEFQPLVDLERFNKPADEFGKDWIEDPRHSLLLPMTPGADSGVSMTKPSTSGLTKLEQDEGLDGGGSPSEQRRKRRDKKRCLALIENGESSGAAQANIAIAVTEPLTPSTLRTRSDASWYSTAETQATEPEEPSPPSMPKAEPSPWLPSAAEHTAKVKAEQARLERLHSRPATPQRPTASHDNVGRGLAHPGSLINRRGGRLRDPSQSILSGNLEVHYRAASQWAESSSCHPGSRSPRFLEVPGGGSGGFCHVRSLASMNSMPTLTELPGPNNSSNNKRGGPVPPVPTCPALWRNQSLSACHRPPTSHGEKPGARQQLRARSGSMNSMRRGYSGAGAGAPGCGEPLPPMPPVPLHLRPSVREGVAVAAGGRSPAMLREVGRSMTVRPQSNAQW
ncbi:hypothetical protein M406DRAFT_326650 [Cryphonectria parasitica EP155]|uniref:PH domain-containing protein n=1 Tax=Cryphonectria parasitica (strain ATCC 38755 / EP155) TaxID=660469 RepID=A0A9P5CVQ7_CRYP1|nr:uncharacterized protein M406DRAFT_326650 [Cryphonectria parasitica EP155]KAF3771261.1 hypothetical protein M406DRAFT_326650 [Cryphonectria parasitica EP155]